jgi:hypothetical protein
VLRIVASTIAVLVGISSAGTSTIYAGDEGSSIPAELIAARFPIGKGACPLLIPVRFGGRDHIFLADTGAEITAIDAAAHVGNRLDSELIATPKGFILMSRYEPPDATLGALPCQFPGGVLSIDLAKVRTASGLAIEGILGMDFLGQHIFHANFDKRELLFLKSLPRCVGVPAPIVWEAGRGPTVVAFVPGCDGIHFNIDTGMVSGLSGTLDTRLVPELVSQGKLLYLGRSSSETLPGTHSSSVYRGQLLALGQFAIPMPLLKASSGYSALGQGFWSRFTVTFDFPGRTVFLTKGRGYGRTDEADYGGLVFGQNGGAVVIEGVLKDSPAMAAGLREGDVLLKLGRLAAKEMSLSELRLALFRPGSIELEVLRGEETLKLTVKIAQ